MQPMFVQQFPKWIMPGVIWIMVSPWSIVRILQYLPCCTQSWPEVEFVWTHWTISASYESSTCKKKVDLLAESSMRTASSWANNLDRYDWWPGTFGSTSLPALVSKVRACLPPILLWPNGHSGPPIQRMARQQRLQCCHTKRPISSTKANRLFSCSVPF